MESLAGRVAQDAQSEDHSPATAYQARASAWIPSPGVRLGRYALSRAILCEFRSSPRALCHTSNDRLVYSAWV